MHIPDGYLCPYTCMGFFTLMAPIWVLAVRKTKKTIKSKYIPTMAVGAAFSFAIMMFNVPIPGGTTGHAVGAGLLSIMFGPWASTLIISVALAIQALIFGDGGISTYATNCFVIAFIPSITSYSLYKFFTKNDSENIKRKVFVSALSGYLGLSAASLVTGIILGLQPIISHTTEGVPIYFSYALKTAIPAMFFEHLFVFGWVEAFVSGLFMYLLLKDNSEFLKLKLGEKKFELN